MELRHLRYFVAVADELNVTRAAERLHMAQQPLSVAIRNLEADLGFDLFERVANRLRLTPAGAAFVVEARALLVAADEAVERGRRTARGALGTLRIGYCSAAMGRILPPAIAAFRERFPDATLALRRLDQAVQLTELDRDEIDLGFIHRPFDERTRASKDVLTERLVIVVPRTHAFAERAAIDPRELAGVPLVRFATGASCAWRGVTDELFATHVVSPRYVDEVTDGETAIGLVAAGAGATILTEHAARLAAQPDLRVVAISSPICVRLAAVWNRDRQNHPLRWSFIDLVNETPRSDHTISVSA